MIDNRPVGGDEVVTACQAACPAKAIKFGNLNDPQSAVARAKAGPRNYALLESSILARGQRIWRSSQPQPRDRSERRAMNPTDPESADSAARCRSSDRGTRMPR